MGLIEIIKRINGVNLIPPTPKAKPQILGNDLPAPTIQPTVAGGNGVLRVSAPEISSVETEQPTADVSLLPMPTIRPRVAAGIPIAEAAPRNPLEKSIDEAEMYRAMKPEDLDQKKDNLWKNLGKAAVEGLRSWAASGGQGGIAGALGAAATGATIGGVNPHFDESMQLGRLQQKADTNVNRQLGLSKQQNALEMQRAQIDLTRAKPEIEQAKIENQAAKNAVDAEHKQNIVKLGVRKADDIKVYREAIVKLKEEGLDQSGEKIALLEKQIDETIRRNKTDDENKDLDRDARVKVAKILAGSREKVAGMQIEAKNTIEDKKTNNKAVLQNLKSADDANKILVQIETKMRSLKNEYGEPLYTDEQINAKKAEFLNNLRPEVRQKLGR